MTRKWNDTFEPEEEKFCIFDLLYLNSPKRKFEKHILYLTNTKIMEQLKLKEGRIFFLK